MDKARHARYQFVTQFVRVSSFTRRVTLRRSSRGFLSEFGLETRARQALEASNVRIQQSKHS